MLKNCLQLLERIDSSYRNYRKLINEGAWGTDPDQDDASLDIRDGLFDEMVNYIVQKYNDILKDKNGQHLWPLICSIEFFLDVANSNDMLFLDEVTKIMGIYNECIKSCEDDTEWLNSWEDTDKIKQSLKERQRNYEKYKALIKADEVVRHNSPSIP